MIELSYWRNVQLELEAERRMRLNIAHDELTQVPGEEEWMREIIHLLMIGSHVGRIGDVEDTI